MHHSTPCTYYLRPPIRYTRVILPSYKIVAIFFFFPSFFQRQGSSIGAIRGRTLSISRTFARAIECVGSESMSCSSSAGPLVGSRPKKARGPERSVTLVFHVSKRGQYCACLPLPYGGQNSAPLGDRCLWKPWNPGRSIGVAQQPGI